jgi:hypothetical protein
VLDPVAGALDLVVVVLFPPMSKIGQVRPLDLVYLALLDSALLLRFSLFWPNDIALVILYLGN